MLAAALAVACGGARSGPAKAGAGERAQADDSSGGTPGGAGEQERGPALPSCDDGTCFRCGDSICPKGFYCDKDARGGPACSWLPACAEAPSCSCVQQALGSGCSCEEEGGGVIVDCD